MLFPKNLLLFSPKSLIFWLIHLRLAIKEGSLFCQPERRQG
ncbi:hypothetical protein MYAER_2915 [Microcystis aeruginosa NIES-2549]|uniref:Uncharacterized protein n=1 Tax=Microcystis aeruginosa NIES-2549 TaxID=1641812 RepID=A0A0F6RM55_MICAE|nr:hypothetical protein MYAER_2915 [Microcystis aeruginosa NIES-2549]